MIDREGADLEPRVHVGHTLTLFCDVGAGRPYPHIQWLLNETVDLTAAAEQTTRRRTVVFGEANKFLQLPAVTIEDQGLYGCVAENPAGRDSMQFRVSLKRGRGLSGCD